MTNQRRISHNDIVNQHTIGFDGLFNQLFNHTPFKNTSYPPYNIIKDNESEITIEIAVAGINKEDIEVSEENQFLKVVYNGSSSSRSEEEYIYRGIADRKFKLEWALKDKLEITNAEYDNGMLRISVKDKSPQEPPRRVIDIK